MENPPPVAFPALQGKGAVAGDECRLPCHRITANGGDSVASDECGKPYALHEKLSGLAFYGYGLSLCMAGLGGRIAGGFDGDKLQIFVHVCAGAVNGNGQAGRMLDGFLMWQGRGACLTGA